MSLHPPNSNVYKSAEHCLKKSKDLIEDFKDYQRKQAEKLLTRKRNNSDTSFGALLKLRAENDLMDSLLPTKGTLLVVPATLLKHWEVGR